MPKDSLSNLFITLFHHKFGTSFALIRAKSKTAAEKKAVKVWMKTDGHDPKNPDEYVEVGVAGVLA